MKLLAAASIVLWSIVLAFSLGLGSIHGPLPLAAIIVSLVVDVLVLS